MGEQLWALPLSARLCLLRVVALGEGSCAGPACAGSGAVSVSAVSRASERLCCHSHHHSTTAARIQALAGLPTAAA